MHPHPRNTANLRLDLRLKFRNIERSAISEFKLPRDHKVRVHPTQIWSNNNACYSYLPNSYQSYLPVKVYWSKNTRVHNCWYFLPKIEILYYRYLLTYSSYQVVEIVDITHLHIINTDSDQTHSTIQTPIKVPKYE